MRLARTFEGVRGMAIRVVGLEGGGLPTQKTAEADAVDAEGEAALLIEASSGRREGE